jgi:uncharacterized coiled-coil DUF342 family protein
MEDYKTLTNEEIKNRMDELNQKFLKLRKLAVKVASEMDSLAEEYELLKQEVNNRNNIVNS